MRVLLSVLIILLLVSGCSDPSSLYETNNKTTTPPPTENLTDRPNSQKTGVEQEVKEIKLAFSTKRIIDNSLKSGEEVIATKGREGRQRYSYQVAYKNGQEIERKLTEVKITEKPIDQIIKVGPSQKTMKTVPPKETTQNTTPPIMTQTAKPPVVTQSPETKPPTPETNQNETKEIEAAPAEVAQEVPQENTATAIAPIILTTAETSNDASPSETTSEPSGYYVGSIYVPNDPSLPTHFNNCKEMRKYYPNGVPQGHPAYDSDRDRDKDGWACEVSSRQKGR